MLVVGDIGGTKTLLASVQQDNNNFKLENVFSFKSNNYKNFENILEEYLSNLDLSCHSSTLSLAVAGPVNKNSSQLTNLNWLIDSNKIKNQTNFKNIFIYNDLEAIAAAVCNDSNNSLDIITIYHSHKSDNENDNSRASKLIVAPGTGLGIAYGIYHSDIQKYIPLPSQGGHISFAPSTHLQWELLTYLQDRTNNKQIGLEQVCSGIGIENIFNFFRYYKKLDLNHKVKAELQNSEDSVPVIISQALNNNCELCFRTIDLFLDILAMTIQTMALTIYSLNGIYLAGGIAVVLKDLINCDIFTKKIFNNSTMFNILESMPIYLALNKNIALIGAKNLVNNL